MSNKNKFVLSSIILLMIMVGFFWVLPGLIFSNGQKNPVTVERPNIPVTKHEPPKQEIKHVFEYKWDMPLDSCGRSPFLRQIRFEPLPEINKPSKIYVKLKSCWETTKESPNLFVIADEGNMDFTQIEPKWLPPIKKGDIYEGSITVIPREVGIHGIVIALITGEARFYFGFNESGELVHLSNRGGFPKNDLPNHPLITDKEIYVKFNGQYVTNLFHITPPLSLGDTSTVYYRVVTKVDYPEGLKLITRDDKNIDFKMLPGPINKGDTLEGSFMAVPPRVGWNSIGLGVEEPPRQGIKPQNDSFSAQCNLLKDGKLLFIAKGQKAYETFFNYYTKKGVQLEK